MTTISNVSYTTYLGLEPWARCLEVIFHSAVNLRALLGG